MTVWRVRDRATLDALRRTRNRARRGPVAVSWTPGDGPPRVAFAIPRGAGTATARNTLRRRLRAVCRELDREGRLPAGAYLFTARAEALHLPHRDLRSAVAAVVDAAVVEAAS